MDPSGVRRGYLFDIVSLLSFDALAIEWLMFVERFAPDCID
jgi:hypothetical protein